MAEETTKTIAIGDMITVGDLAAKLDITPTELIGELFKNGVMTTVNETIDFDTAEIMVSEIAPDVMLEKKVAEAEVTTREERELTDNAVDRPPVVAVMGHVDHGKTSLLDAIRDADVAAGEAGGITQHISAYQITHNDRKVTFLDTPGHEAFAALREHGAKLTDVAVIVVAADDGVKPQTKEAIRYAQRAGVKIVVAINKVDKPGADSNRTKQQLSEENLLVEEWGGDVVAVEVSAKEKTNIDKLIDMVLLVADVEELKAEEDIPAEGIIIEAHMEQGRGPVATALVEHGVLETGAVISAGGAYAKVRTLTTTSDKEVEKAGPSFPVVITGFKSLPRFGDVFHVHKNEKTARAAAAQAEADAQNTERMQMSGSDLIAMIDKSREQQNVNVIVRADVQGSLKSVIDSLRGLENKEVTARVVGRGVGGINENDIRLAASSDAIIYGFNVDLPTNIKRLAAQEGVTVRVFKVIYELIDDIKDEMSNRLADEIVETEAGRLIVKGVFRTTKDTIICGGEVTKGKITAGLIAKISRDKEPIAEAIVKSVQRNQNEAKEVVEGDMCGLELTVESKVLIEIDDRIDFVSREAVERTL